MTTVGRRPSRLEKNLGVPLYRREADVVFRMTNGPRDTGRVRAFVDHVTETLRDHPALRAPDGG